MNKFLSLCSILLSINAFAADPITPAVKSTNEMATGTSLVTTSDQNPLLSKWVGPYGGIPPFDKVRVSMMKDALEVSMNENLTEIEKIANNTEAATFENTIAALERSGQTLDRIQTIYGVWSSTMNDSSFQTVEREMAPKLAAFSDKITQNEKLFARISTVFNSKAKTSLTPEQQRLTWIYYTNFVRAGAQLDEASKTRMSQINQELAGLFTRFSQNLLADEMDNKLVLTNEADLAGLPQSLIDAAASSAGDKKGTWVIKNTRSSVDPFLT